jgi:hypothetical protein
MNANVIRFFNCNKKKEKINKPQFAKVTQTSASYCKYFYLSYDNTACTINKYIVVIVTCMRKERKLRLSKAMKDGR